jgi:thioredoxin 1
MKQVDFSRINGYSVILFISPNCNPCKQMKSIIQELENAHADKATFYEVNTVKSPDLVSFYNIKSVPTVVFQNENLIKDRFAGFLDTVDIENKLMNLLFDFEEGLD